MKRKNESRNTNHEPRLRVGSALILVVVLTSLLAIVGVMFVMVARVDRMATSAISENKTLDSAVEVVIAKISQELVLDVPGVAGQPDYYDYPDGKNAWLASLEPYDSGVYKWRQISDVTGFLNDKGFSTQNVNVKPVGLSTTVYVREYPVITLDGNGELKEQSADADGDGIADSKWIELDDITSNKGKAIYAAIRIIDNGAMLNVNTAYKFDPNGPGVTADDIDGSRLAQIHMLDFVKGVSDDVDDLHRFRCDGNEPDLLTFNEECAIRIENPDRTSISYLPYDIGDELELRNRFVLDGQNNITRIETALPITLTYPKGKLFGNRFAPIDTSDDFKVWKKILNPLDPNDSYNFRHLLATYNFDRIINPYGGKMVNVNKAGVSLIYSAIKLALFTADPDFKDVDRVAAQTAVNLVDFRDKDSDVTPLPDVNGITYYGFERPCVYISELAHRFVKFHGGIIKDGKLIEPIYKSYAIELHKPYPGDDYLDPNDWRLVIGSPRVVPIGGVPIGDEYGIDWSGNNQFYVIRNENPSALLPEIGIDAVVWDSSTFSFDERDLIELQRRVDDVNDIWLTVDSRRVPPKSEDVGGWLNPGFDAVAHSIQRDITPHKCIRRLWDTGVKAPTLGSNNVYETGDSVYIQAHPENEDFTNVGEIGMVFRRNAYGINGIGYSSDKDEEDEVRLDLADPNYQRIFKYLTCFDPTSDGIDNDGDGFLNESDPTKPEETPEFKVPGRININTAPWYVIAQLPWVSDKLAQAIVAYRDKLDMDPNGPDYYHDGANDSRYQETGIRGLREADGFASIGELATVVNDSGEDDYSMRYYTLGAESGDLVGFPDLTTPDHPLGGAEDDFEERDLIFARISNLVTVRSDVFTAYILVRIGADGPQKRIMAILDRSNVYPPEGGKVRIVALHPVADPR